MRNSIIKLFNLEPDDLEGIEVTSTDYTTYVYITLRKHFQTCPKCNCSTKVVHDYRRRTINYAILNGTESTIIFNQRRYRCTNCDAIFPEANPFVLPSKRVSKYLILRVMQLLRNPRITFSHAAEEANISVSTAMRIFDRYAGITPIELPKCLCIDEVYASKYKQNVYACVLVDMSSSQIYDLLPSRTKYELASYFSKIDINERNQVEYVCIDMWDNYKQLVLTYFPKAKVCVDSFHVIQLINRAFTKIRVRVMNKYPRNSEEYRLLKKYTWVLNTPSDKLDRGKVLDLRHYYYSFNSRYVRTDILIDKLLSFDVDLMVAYSIKEEYSYWNKHATSKNAARHIDRIIEQMRASDITELKSVAKTLKRWKEEIVNSFDRYNGRRISNGPIESVNSRIKTIKRNGNGYSNFERFRKRVLYSLNKNSSIKL